MPHVPSILNPSIIVLESNAKKMLLAFQKAIALNVAVMTDMQLSKIPTILQVTSKISSVNSGSEHQPSLERSFAKKPF